MKNGAAQKHRDDLEREILRIIKAYAVDHAFSYQNNDRIPEGRALHTHARYLADTIIDELQRHYKITRKPITQRTLVDGQA